MTTKKVKSPAKMFCSDNSRLQSMVTSTMDEVSEIVGSSYGPGGKVTLIESEYPGIPNTNTKDGVTIFKSLGAADPYKHLIIEQTRDAAQRTASEAGDGTTATTIISASLVKNLFDFCRRNPKESPQRAVRVLNKIVKEQIIPQIKDSSIKITLENQHLLKKVAQVSANGDEEMADAVMSAFDMVGFGESSHVTIQELSGPGGYEVEKIEGFPIPIGFEDSVGKFHTAFINDRANQRCVLDKPLFILFDGQLNDLVSFSVVLNELGSRYVQGESDFKNLIIVAHGFSEAVLTQLAFNFANPNTLNVVPLATPMNQIKNSRLEFLYDMAAFTGAKIFDLNNQVAAAAVDEDFGKGMEQFEYYRFRSTVIGSPEEMNIEERAEQLETQLKNSVSLAEKTILEERLGKLTGGIAKLKIYGASNGELKERHDRCEDAVCAVRSAIKHGCLPGACRIVTNIAVQLASIEDDNRDVKILKEVLMPALVEPLHRLLDNAGYNEEEIQEIFAKYTEDLELVYDIENQVFGKAEDLGIFDASMAVTQALENSLSIAHSMGSLGGIVCSPRDNQLELQAWKEEQAFKRAIDHADEFTNEANERHAT